jgi:uncharacterized protein YndB with AHSA1/START domain
MSNKTTLTAEPGSPIIRIERTFDAPPVKVFLAFTLKDKIERWWSPSGNARIDDLDAREGGKWRFTHVMPEGQEITFFGYFHEITPPERIVQTAEFASMPVRGHVVLDKYEFTKLDNGRTHMELTEAFMSVADRDAAVEAGVETGLAQSYLNLDTVLQEMKKRDI